MLGIALVHLLIGGVLSFVMSIPIGPVNIAVIQTSIDRGKTLAYRIALGASLAELIFCLLAVNGLSLLFENPEVQRRALMFLHFGSVPLLLMLGFQQLVVSAPNAALTTNATSNRFIGIKPSFWLGFSLNISNPLLLVAWTGLIAFLQSKEWISEDLILLSFFAVGAGAGAFSFQALLAEISYKRIFNLNQRKKKSIHVFAGISFIAFALYQLIGIFKQYL